ncbi:hypothetical protein ACIPYU_19625 [Paenarthrobacter nicotinovorans]|uniref:hypothetical protein n=1 Tax=Paenarthrobacter nicotinovorans TaxID=29320 RepID=UPI00382DE303
MYAFIDGKMAKLTAIDPTTGTESQVAYFLPKEDAVAIDSQILLMNYDSVPVRRAMFSPDFSKVTAIKNMPDGTRHVGWIDTNGAFSDISASTGAGSSQGFSSAKSQDTPMFGTDGSFYFASRDAGGSTKTQPTIMKVDPKAKDKATATKVIPDSEGVNYFVNPDGSINGGTTSVLYQNGRQGVGVYNVQDWITDVEYVEISPGGESTNIYRENAATRDKDMLPYGISGRPLLPKTNRQVFSPIVSPDKSRIAFLSKAPNSSTIDLFTVDSAGQTEPKQITLKANSLSTKTRFLAWK